MPSVWIEVEFEGKKGKAKMPARLNSGADYVALPEDLAKEIEPEFLRVDEVILADGTKRKEKVFKVTARIIDNKGKTRKCTTEAIVSKRAVYFIKCRCDEKAKNNSRCH
jgi:predicted aspartyl protease